MTDQNKRMRPWLLGLILAAIIFLIGFVVFRALGFGDDPVIGAGATSEIETTSTQPAGETSTSRIVPSGPAETDGITFTYWDGSTGQFEDFRGTPLVVNFWASWCPACVAEMPDLEAVHTTLGDQVEFLGANTQEVDRREAQKLVNQTKVTYLLFEDPNGEIYSFFGGISMPTTVFIDEAGNVVDVHSGAIFADDLEAKIRDNFGL